ncbi:hypothetical protein UlMin_000276 [Ulmus minor]
MEQKRGSCSLSSPEMEALRALCDTFLPSIEDVAGDDSVLKFYGTSASMAATPEEVERLMREKLKHPKRWLLLLGLWALSNWLGTFVLCGRASLCRDFPYFQSFPMLSSRKREEIVISWSRSYFLLLRMFSKAFNFLTLLIFFTQVDEKDQNPAWKAIGYNGPDPDLKAQIRSQLEKSTKTTHDQIEAKQQKQSHIEDEVFGPLYRGIININKNTQHKTVDTLSGFGFPAASSSSSSQSLTIQCDAVVVGSGSGGGVVAGVLAKADYKVLVLEKGNYHARKNLTLLEGASMDQMYLSSGLLATEDMSVLVLAGSTVGGGSTINWSASIRTPNHVTKEWCHQHELELFESKLYEEAMDVVCQRMGVQSEVQREGFNNAVLRKGCQELGFTVNNIPRNSPSDHYCGWCCLGCKDGRKKGTSETWLVDLVKSGNGVILPGCEAVKVLHNRQKGRTKNRVTGVVFEYEYKGKKERCVVESKVFIVAGGALSTPKLLKDSGLKNAHIGKNLHLHPVSMAWGYFPENSSSGAWPETEKKSFEGGIMTAMSTVAADFENSSYGAVIQTPALHPGMFSILMPWLSGKDIKDRMRKFSRTAHIFTLARDKGSGEVKSPNSISYQMEDFDEENLHKGLEKILRILAAAGAEEIGTHHSEGRTKNVRGVSSEEFEKFVKEESWRPIRKLSSPICSAHQMGSCKMGVDPKSSAVNPKGETWEVEGLFVADTSVFPTALGVNPMVTVQAIAYCTAQSVLEVLRKKIK